MIRLSTAGITVTPAHTLRTVITPLEALRSLSPGRSFHDTSVPAPLAPAAVGR